MMIEAKFIFLVFPNNNENVRHEIMPAISLKNTFSTPMLYLLDEVVVFTGFSKTVAGIVQKTTVVPNIENIDDTFEGSVLTLASSYFLFKKML